MGREVYSVFAFFELLRAGLWGKKCSPSFEEFFDWRYVYRLSKEQSVLGLLVSGIEQYGLKPPSPLSLKMVSEIHQIECRNEAMNAYLAELIQEMNAAGINVLLVKGQGIAQCYNQPLRRVSGDIDFLSDAISYKKAIHFMLPKSTHANPERRYSKHKSFVVPPWYVEIHGSLRTGLSSRVDRVIDGVQYDTFVEHHTRIWEDGDTHVVIPEINNDVFFVFTHFLMHFYREQIKLKQICDWCRALWSYRLEINAVLLEKRLHLSGLMEEWKAFASFAVDYLGMPSDAMPFYDDSKKKKGETIMAYILKGEGRNVLRNTIEIAKIFPKNTILYLPSILFNVNGMKIKERLFNRNR